MRNQSRAITLSILKYLYKKVYNIFNKGLYYKLPVFGNGSYMNINCLFLCMSNHIQLLKIQTNHFPRFVRDRHDELYTLTEDSSHQFPIRGHDELYIYIYIYIYIYKWKAREFAGLKV